MGGKVRVKLYDYCIQLCGAQCKKEIDLLE